jgi:hypothetical protein
MEDTDFGASVSFSRRPVVAVGYRSVAVSCLRFCAQHFAAFDQISPAALSNPSDRLPAIRCNVVERCALDSIVETASLNHS